jgi:hypothetical protein
MTLFRPAPESWKVLNSVLDSRIDQAIAITLPTDKSRIDILHSIKNLDSYSIRVASFSDYLIDYITTLSVELNAAQIALGQRPGSTVQTQNNKHDTHQWDEDYNQALALLKTSRNNLSLTIEGLVQENQTLRRRRKHDQRLLVRQNALLQKFKRHVGLQDNEVANSYQLGKCTSLQREFEQIASELAKLETEIEARMHHGHRTQ